jgi:hypothetical protein
VIPFYRTPIHDISILPSPQLVATVGPHRPTREPNAVASFPSSPIPKHTRALPEAAGLALGFEKNQDVVLANWTQVVLVAGRSIGAAAGHTRALDVPDDGTGGVVHKLDAHLGDATTRTCVASTSAPGRN